MGIYRHTRNSGARATLLHMLEVRKGPHKSHYILNKGGKKNHNSLVINIFIFCM